MWLTEKVIFITNLPTGVPKISNIIVCCVSTLRRSGAAQLAKDQSCDSFSGFWFSVVTHACDLVGFSRSSFEIPLFPKAFTLFFLCCTCDVLTFTLFVILFYKLLTFISTTPSYCQYFTLAKNTFLNITINVLHMYRSYQLCWHAFCR